MSSFSLNGARLKSNHDLETSFNGDNGYEAPYNHCKTDICGEREANGNLDGQQVYHYEYNIANEVKMMVNYGDNESYMKNRIRALGNREFARLVIETSEQFVEMMNSSPNLLMTDDFLSFTSHFACCILYNGDDLEIDESVCETLTTCLLSLLTSIGSLTTCLTVYRPLLDLIYAHRNHVLSVSGPEGVSVRKRATLSHSLVFSRAKEYSDSFGMEECESESAWVVDLEMVRKVINFAITNANETGVLKTPAGIQQCAQLILFFDCRDSLSVFISMVPTSLSLTELSLLPPFLQTLVLAKLPFGLSAVEQMLGVLSPVSACPSLPNVTSSNGGAPPGIFHLANSPGRIRPQSATAALFGHGNLRLMAHPPSIAAAAASTAAAKRPGAYQITPNSIRPAMAGTCVLGEGGSFHGATKGRLTLRNGLKGLPQLRNRPPLVSTGRAVTSPNQMSCVSPSISPNMALLGPGMSDDGNQPSTSNQSKPPFTDASVASGYREDESDITVRIGPSVNSKNRPESSILERSSIVHNIEILPEVGTESRSSTFLFDGKFEFYISVERATQEHMGVFLRYSSSGGAREPIHNSLVCTFILRVSTSSGKILRESTAKEARMDLGSGKGWTRFLSEGVVSPYLYPNAPTPLILSLRIEGVTTSQPDSLTTLPSLPSVPTVETSGSVRGSSPDTPPNIPPFNASEHSSSTNTIRISADRPSSTATVLLCSRAVPSPAANPSLFLDENSLNQRHVASQSHPTLQGVLAEVFVDREGVDSDTQAIRRQISVLEQELRTVSFASSSVESGDASSSSSFIPHHTTPSAYSFSQVLPCRVSEEDSPPLITSTAHFLHQTSTPREADQSLVCTSGDACNVFASPALDPLESHRSDPANPKKDEHSPSRHSVASLGTIGENYYSEDSVCRDAPTSGSWALSDTMIRIQHQHQSNSPVEAAHPPPSHHQVACPSSFDVDDGSSLSSQQESTSLSSQHESSSRRAISTALLRAAMANAKAANTGNHSPAIPAIPNANHADGRVQSTSSSSSSTTSYLNRIPARIDTGLRRLSPSRPQPSPSQASSTSGTGSLRSFSSRRQAYRQAQHPQQSQQLQNHIIE